MRLYLNLFANKQGRVKFFAEQTTPWEADATGHGAEDYQGPCPRLASPRLLCGLHTHTGYKVFPFFLT